MTAMNQINISRVDLVVSHLVYVNVFAPAVTTQLCHVLLV